jgi:hypothetical protein
MDTNELTKAYDEVAKFTDAAFMSGRVAIACKEAFENKSARAIMDGTITGKNDTERKAASIMLYQKDYAEMNAANDSYEMQRNELTLAKIHLDCLRDILRIEELAKQ